MSSLIRYDDEGREVLDDTPVELPLQFKRPPSIEDMIRRAIRTEMSREAADKGFETFEDADDFQVEDDEDFVSPYELTEMQEESIVPTDASNLERQKGGNNGKDSNSDADVKRASDGSKRDSSGNSERGASVKESKESGNSGVSQEGSSQSGGNS